MKRAFLVAGESSGDLHGALLAEELRRRAPHIELFGVGGPRMAEAGVELVVRSDDLAVVGVAEVLSMLPRILTALRCVDRAFRELRPQVFVPIDYPDFNFRLLPRARARGIPIAYYIGPQVWAWRSSRIAVLRRHVQRMIVIFPFEEALYREQGVPVTWVGHPLVDRVPADLASWRRTLRTEHGVDASRTVVSWLPGSRPSELTRLAAVLHAARARLDHDTVPGGRPLWILGRAPGLPDSAFSGLERDAQAASGLEALGLADLSVTASGTATLEGLLTGTPMVVVYRVNRLTYALARRLVRVPHIAMANLVAGERVVPELVQHEATPDRIATEVRRLLSNPEERRRIRVRLESARARLGAPGAAGRAAEAVLEVLEGA